MLSLAYVLGIDFLHPTTRHAYCVDDVVEDDEDEAFLRRIFVWMMMMKPSFDGSLYAAD